MYIWQQCVGKAACSGIGNSIWPSNIRLGGVGWGWVGWGGVVVTPASFPPSLCLVLHHQHPAVNHSFVCIYNLGNFIIQKPHYESIMNNGRNNIIFQYFICLLFHWNRKKKIIRDIIGCLLVHYISPWKKKLKNTMKFSSTARSLSVIYFNAQV